MKTDYSSSYALWLELQDDGKLTAEPDSCCKSIWKITEKISGDFGYVFVDETECFYPKIFKTVDEAVSGMKRYIEQEL